MAIHATALVDPGAALDASVEVGPYAVIGPHVRIGAGTTVHAYSHLDAAEVGARAVIGPYARLRPGAVRSAPSVTTACGPTSEPRSVWPNSGASSMSRLSCGFGNLDSARGCRRGRAACPDDPGLLRSPP